MTLISILWLSQLSCHILIHSSNNYEVQHTCTTMISLTGSNKTFNGHSYQMLRIYQKVSIYKQIKKAQQISNKL